eukprot:657693-Hanusia_phi.AAC.1
MIESRTESFNHDIYRHLQPVSAQSVGKGGGINESSMPVSDPKRSFPPLQGAFTLKQSSGPVLHLYSLAHNLPSRRTSAESMAAARREADQDQRRRSQGSREVHRREGHSAARAGDRHRRESERCRS